MINNPKHDFHATGADPLAHEVIVTPELQAWAADAVEQLNAGGWHVPPGLELVRDGQTLTRNRWWWLLNDVLSPRKPPPF